MNTSRENLLTNMEGDVVDSISANLPAQAQAKPSEQKNSPKVVKKSPPSSRDERSLSPEVLIQKKQSDSESSERTLAGSSSHDDEPITATLTPRQESLPSPNNPSTTIIIDPTACTDVADAPHTIPDIRPASPNYQVEPAEPDILTICLCCLYCLNYNQPVQGRNIYKYLVVTYFALFCFATSAAVFGIMNMEECPAAPKTGVHVFIIGIMCMFTLGGKLVEACHQYIEQRPVRWFPRSICVSMFIASFILLIFEMMDLYRFHPSVVLASENYCEPLFYEYTYYANFACIVIMFIMSSCFCARACRDRNDRLEYLMNTRLPTYAAVPFAAHP